MVLTKVIIFQIESPGGGAGAEGQSGGGGRVEVHDAGEGAVGVDELDVPAEAGDGEEVGDGEGAEGAGPDPGGLGKEEG